jgi:hypothetical protein
LLLAKPVALQISRESTRIKQPHPSGCWCWQFSQRAMIGVVQRRRDWIPGHVRLGNKAKSVPSSVGANTDRALERDRGVWGRHGITAELSWYIIDHSMNSWPGKRTSWSATIGLWEVSRICGTVQESSYLVDPASSHMLVSKIKPCMSKYKQHYTVKLRMAH